MIFYAMTFLQKLHMLKANSLYVIIFFSHNFFCNEIIDIFWISDELYFLASRLGFSRISKQSLRARYPLGSLLHSAAFARRVVVYGESNGEGNRVPGDFKKLTGTPSSTPINSISRYFAASRHAMNIALFLTFRPPLPRAPPLYFLARSNFFLYVTYDW